MAATMAARDRAAGLIFAAPTITADPFDGIQAVGGGGGRVLFLDDAAAVPNVSVNVDGGAFGDQPGTVDFGFLGTPSGVPEPATRAMMLVGFGAIGFAACRRQNVSVTHA